MAVITSAVNTAQEGEFLGQRWSSAMVPLRAVLGFSVLIPTTQGYSIIQIVVMWIIVQGVGMGNFMWGTLLEYFESGSSMSTGTDLTNLQNGTRGLFQAAVCAKINEKLASDSETMRAPDGSSSDEDDEITISWSDRLIDRDDKITIYQNPSDLTEMYIGVEDGGDSKAHLCGTVNLTQITGLTANQNILIAYEQQAILRHVFTTLYLPAAIEAAESPIDSLMPTSGVRLQFWTQEGVVKAGRDYIFEKYIALKEKYLEVNNNHTNLANAAKRSGWILAGSYYRSMVEGSSGQVLALSKVPGVAADNTNGGGLDYYSSHISGPDGMTVKVYSLYKNRADLYVDYSEAENYVPGRRRNEYAQQGC